jgi:hypothetical protein
MRLPARGRVCRRANGSIPIAPRLPPFSSIKVMRGHVDRQRKQLASRSRPRINLQISGFLSHGAEWFTKREGRSDGGMRGGLWRVQFRARWPPALPLVGFLVVLWGQALTTVIRGHSDSVTACETLALGAPRRGPAATSRRTLFGSFRYDLGGEPREFGVAVLQHVRWGTHPHGNLGQSLTAVERHLLSCIRGPCSILAFGNGLLAGSS